MLTIIGAISELERSLIVERVKAGMRRAKLEGRRIGRTPLNIDRAEVVERPPFWNVVNSGCEKAQDFAGFGLPTRERSWR